MIAWDKVTTPKDNGGLGMVNFRVHNRALLMKHLYKFYNKQSTPWVHLIWNSHYKEGRIPHNSSEKGLF